MVQTLIMAGGEVRLSKPKTRRSRRVIDLDPGTVEALTEWRQTQQAERAERGAAWSNPADLVFTREDGSPLRPDSWGGSMFQRLCDDAGVPRIPSKNQRHTHATHLLAAGIPPKEVSYRLGHHSTGFTQDVYADRLPGAGAHVAAVMARLVGETQNGTQTPPEIDLVSADERQDVE